MFLSSARLLSFAIILPLFIATVVLYLRDCVPLQSKSFSPSSLRFGRVARRRYLEYYLLCDLFMHGYLRPLHNMSEASSSPWRSLLSITLGAKILIKAEQNNANKKRPKQ